MLWCMALIEVTGYVLLRMLSKKNKVKRSAVKSFLIRTLPVEAGIVANSSPAEIDKEIDTVISVVNGSARTECITEKEDVLIADTADARCAEKIEEILERYETLTKIKNTSLLGKYISMIEPLLTA